MFATRRRRVTGRSLAALQITLLVAAAIGPIPVTTTFAAGNAAVQLNGSSQYVTFGAAAGHGELGASVFTLELWFKRTGAGVGTSTGTGGIASAIPLISKGRAEAETPANLNMNYFLGIDATTGTLVADFEDTVDGGNHPVAGTAVDHQQRLASRRRDLQRLDLHLLPRRRPRPDGRSGRPRSCPRRPASSTPASAAR